MAIVTLKRSLDNQQLQYDRVCRAVG